ncbi:MAG: S-layer homology domain-containing protein [Fischerella sp.]|uniref:S-layer homology domain-containing protein n=1 Tax=Fischerella sp. TaxID=1191 RepID=UPI0017AC083C|nr:S-layer homology domain-containing protein [Fischerella sp.]NWF60655.1 S-layer homology domain-containing protein [Fischerella sp.]
MTNTPPDPKSSQTNALGFEEFIGILVAFATIGVILFWSFSRKESGWNLGGLLLPSPTQSPVPTTPTVESRQAPPSSEEKPPVVEKPLPRVSPGELRREQTLLPPDSTRETLPLVIPEKKPTIPPPIAFTDVPSDFWARRFIDVLSSRNIIKGYQDYSFRPNQPVSRAEFAAILQQAFRNGLGYTNEKMSFQDVPTQFWANSAIDQAINTGFLKGYPNKTFNPNQKISRTQVLVALASGLNLKVPASPNQVLSVYKDAREIPTYATNKIAAATESGLVVNYPDTTVLAANKQATRAEVAAMIYQALVRMRRVDAIQSEYIVKVPD